MKKPFFDIRLIFGLILAHTVMFFSFNETAIFWYIFSGSILVLITYATFQEEVDDRVSFFSYIVFGAVSGIILYLLFWLGYHTIGLLSLSFEKHINKLYRWYAPSWFWQYLSLILIASPGEELFWRGFVQKRLNKYFNPLVSIVTASILYASVAIYSGSFLLVLATFLSGLVWGFLYFRKQSMPLVIVSHIVFDILIFIIFPLTY